MNLIEQLGGYENSRCCLESCGDMDYIGGFTPLQIQEALLQYRREHGIFEVKDFVVDKISGQFFQIIEIDGDQFVNQCLFWCKLIWMRHASDAEIKAGHRLELEILNDHDIPPNTTILEK